MAGSFKFSLGGMEHKLGKFDNKLDRAVTAVMGFYAPKTEAWMKHKAPWTDQTTNARNGLFSEPFKKAGSAGIVLAHSVDYGIYLETKPKRKGGRPIINPALKTWGPRVMKKLNRLIDRMGR